jgi:MoaA/NifB/PqqE/SkfB family radical SAM enzyme
LRAHVESVNLSGGEPFAHPVFTPFAVGLLRFYGGLKEICVNTDGHLLAEIEAALAVLIPICARQGVKCRIYVSLDGRGEAHDRHRRHSGAFALADRALRRLRDLRGLWPEHLRVTASFTITEFNADQILPVFRYVRELGLRADFVLAARPEVFIGGAGLDGRFQVRPEQAVGVRAAIEEICAYPEHLNYSSAYYATMLQTLETGRRSRGCFFPDKGFVLMPDGKVYICGTYWDFFFGDFNGSDFETLWNGRLRSDCRGRKIPGKCATCFASSYEDWDLVTGAQV